MITSFPPIVLRLPLFFQIAGDNIVFAANEENRSKLQSSDEALHPEEGIRIAGRLLAMK